MDIPHMTFASYDTTQVGNGKLSVKALYERISAKIFGYRHLFIYSGRNREPESHVLYILIIHARTVSGTDSIQTKRIVLVFDDQRPQPMRRKIARRANGYTDIPLQQSP